MKKRLIAFLLVLIMVLGMLPVSALAVDGDATMYTYHLIHEFNYVGGTRWDITAKTAAESYQLDVNKGKPTRNGYTFLGWADKADATAAQYHGGDLIPLTKDKPTKTIYAVWKENPPLDIPNPNPGNIAENLKVKVVCTTPNSGHEPASYSLIDGTFTHTDVDQSGDYPTCSITITPTSYISKYSDDTRCKHTTSDQPKTVPLFWNKEAQKWAVNDSQIGRNGVVFNAVCEAVPDTFTVTYTDGVDGEEVFADQVYSGLRKDSATPAFNGTPTRTGYTFAGWQPRVAETVTKTVTYVAKWTPVGPTRKDIFDALNDNVTVTCINRFWKDGNKNMDCGECGFAAKAGIVGQKYTLEKGKDDTTWVVTFPVTNFVKSFKQDPAHNLYTKDTLSWYIRWENNAWTSAPVKPGVDNVVKLTHAPTDWREVAKIATGGKSDCIHTHCVNSGLNVCDYGITVPFVNFKEDVVSVKPEAGKPGSYIATFKVDKFVDARAKVCNDKNFPDAPRTHKLLTQETVQWRLYATSEADEKIGNNVLNHVWEAEPVEAGKDDVCTIAHNWVVTFNPDNGEPAFKQNVEYEGKATEPAAPEKTGYTFDGWYLDEAEAPFSFDTTITSDITLTAKWHVTPHNIYAYARLNSYFAPLTNVEFDEYVKLNAATLERLGLGSYNANDFISIGKFRFNQLPLTEDLYFGDDAELDAVAAELAKSIALETGVSKETAEKIAWTVLFKTENEEDMAPGYPAEDGYQLSGNLNLASVTFRAGAENVENMPAVNYTYDDGAIDFYDFYFAGDTITMPADPTRAKYTFMGWKAQVLPAEDDLDVYADGAETDEGATLYKAGDTYTITDGGVIFTAQWELTATPIGDIYVRYDVLHIKQLPDGTYDLANAEVEHLSAKKDSTVTAVIKDYRATHHVNVNRTLSKLTGTAIQPYMGVDGKPVYTILSVYYDLDFHTLTFDTMGGSRIDPVTVRHGNAVAKPKDPVNGGYIFDGWYTDKTFRHRYDFSTPLTEDITIYAKWFLIVLPGVTVKKNTPKLNTADHFAYVQGYPDGTVKPAGNITRAETAAILFRLMDDASRKTYYSTKSGFRDVASGSWYNTYVATLNNAGVITDSSNGYFRPNEAITRAELAAMLAKFSETTGAANYFNDVSAKYWAANAIAICAKLGWITGYPDGTFRPDKNVTRAELMAMINRATGRAPKSADAFPPGMKTWIDNTADKWYYLDVQEATNSHSYTVKGSETWTALTSDPNWSLYE